MTSEDRADNLNDEGDVTLRYNDGSYLGAHPNWHSEDSTWKADELSVMLPSDLILTWKKLPFVRVVEYGCGAGGVLNAVVQRLRMTGLEVEGLGVDISGAAISLARSQYQALMFSCTDFVNVKEHADLALAIDVIEHLPKPEALLAHLRSKSTHQLFHIPLDENLYDRLKVGSRYYEWLRADRGHLHYFTRPSALNLLSENGLRIVGWRYTFWGQQPGRSCAFVRHVRTSGYKTFPTIAVRLFGGASLAVLTMSS